MRKHATTLIAPLAALAVVGTVGAGTAYATDDGYDGYGDGPGATSVQIETSDETEAALGQAGASLDAIEPATAEQADDGTVDLSFPASGDQDVSSGQAAFDGGIALSGASSDTSWLDPTLDTSDWQVSFTVDGQQVDLLQAVPQDGSPEAELALTTEGADALNAVVGDDTFAAGDVFGDAGPAAQPSDGGWDHADDQSDQGTDHAWDESHEGWDHSDQGWGDSGHASDHSWGEGYQDQDWGR